MVYQENIEIQNLTTVNHTASIQTNHRQAKLKGKWIHAITLRNFNIPLLVTKWKNVFSEMNRKYE